MKFHQNCGRYVSLSEDRSVVELSNQFALGCLGDWKAYSAEPSGNSAFAVRIQETKARCSGSRIALGVTTCSPDSGELGSSWFICGDGLYKDNITQIKTCPALRVSTGDTVGVKHTDTGLIFYKNRSVHYTWAIKIPGPVWGMVAMMVGGVKSVRLVPDLPDSMTRWQGQNRNKIYRMRTVPRGYCVIVNMFNFYGKDARTGSDLDVINLEVTWRTLRYDVITWIDKDADELVEALKTLSQNRELSNHDSFVLILMSHGHKGHILGSDGESINLKKIFWMFDNVKCPCLRNKPKLFFIQACRGEKEDRNLSDADVEQVSDAMKLPEISDMMVMYATMSDYMSWRTSTDGSYLIKALTQVLDKESDKMNLMDMLTEIIRRVRSGDKQKTQSPIFKSTLAKQLWFYPVE